MVLKLKFKTVYSLKLKMSQFTVGQWICIKAKPFQIASVHPDTIDFRLGLGDTTYSAPLSDVTLFDRDEVLQGDNYAGAIPPVGSDLGDGRTMTTELYNSMYAVLIKKPPRANWCGTR